MAFWNRFRASSANFESGVLMVCTANICRSPLAAAALHQRLVRAGLDRRVCIESAGTHADRGAPPDPRAVAAGRRRGLDLAKSRSKRVDDADFERFEWVLAMDQDNLGHLAERCPEPFRARVGLLLDVAPRDDGEREVPDPYFGSPAGFERVLDLIEPACDALLLRLQQRLVDLR
jgi:protein-tyrosine phosphatase